MKIWTLQIQIGLRTVFSNPFKYHQSLTTLRPLKTMQCDNESVSPKGWCGKNFTQLFAASFILITILTAILLQWLGADGVFYCRKADSVDWKNATSIYDFKAKDIDGNEVSLEKYRGHVCIIVNLACKCGLTGSNYPQLQALHDKFAESKGLRILGFPCNQFAGQEPGSEAEIKDFIKQYDVKFDMFSKIKVNGDDAHPLWNYLKSKQGGLLGDFIKWNFTKFLIDKEGQPVKRYGPNVNPSDIEKDLEAYW